MSKPTYYVIIYFHICLVSISPLAKTAWRLFIFGVVVDGGGVLGPYPGVSRGFSPGSELKDFS